MYQNLIQLIFQIEDFVLILHSINPCNPVIFKAHESMEGVFHHPSFSPLFLNLG